jgi:phosphotransferase system  glucose/maltose/N-acetylglucosamine-specific IIC component
MRTFMRVLAVLVLVALVIGIGTAIYNQGMTAGVAEAARVAAASGDPVPVNPYGYGWGGAPYAHGPFGSGFGAIFGILFAAFAIVLIVGLVRLAFGGWRGGPGAGGWGGRGHRVEEWHRELHRREGSSEQGGA